MISKKVRKEATYEILTCDKCGEKYFMDTEIMDNVYACLMCHKDLTKTNPQVYVMEENKLCKLIEENFKGIEGESYC